MDIAGLSYKTPKKSILPTCYCEFYSAWCHYVFDPPPTPPPPPPETYPHLGYHPSPPKKCSTVHKAYTKRCQFMTFEKVTIVWLLTNA